MLHKGHSFRHHCCFRHTFPVFTKHSITWCNHTHTAEEHSSASSVWDLWCGWMCVCVIYRGEEQEESMCFSVSYEGRGVEICSWESQDRHTVFVDWRERGGGLCVYAMVWEQREGWWFGPGDCKSLWPALMSSGWQRCLSPRHSSTCPSRPPYWSHIGHPTPLQKTFLLLHSLLQLHF